MGVCTEERPVMHWQQSARFLGPGVREKSSTTPGSKQVISNYETVPGTNINHQLFSSCSSCTDVCDHSTKPFRSTLVESFKSFKVAELGVFRENSGKYSTQKSSGISLEVNDETNSGMSFKTEPYGPPSSPDSTAEPNLPRNIDDCAGCGRFIQDRFYLSAVEKRWHVNCLQCYACRQPLDRESSCYSRDGNIYCKSDYFSFFGTRRCSRCLASISSSELVMRAKNLVFHVNCFSCAVCRSPLTKGDQFGIVESLVYCRTHYAVAREEETSTNLSNSTFTYVSQFGSPHHDSSSPHSDPNRIVPSNIFVPSSHIMPGLPQPPRQKGRPRKRKPKEIEALTANMDLSTEYLDYGRASHLTSSSRTKRMRTSFKHHQLRTMKSYFAINHNPDAKDLKQLSQKTGLPKRVLQVWFQNARAKWRRMMMKQDGSSMLEKGEIPLDLDSISAHSPTSFIMGRRSTSPPHNLD
ncbi:protein apterous [Teleopsis dalmanni]|uniref:protein apterous n=1 Tax=Teleopsis dalmanni TaxID=139649 RepID=UPI0018CE0895|nr:protein apterous [Teleopsis dalmanni]